ncbi:MAG: hypothetical protein P8X64_17470 [Anaerolineales bacterium]|jgi:hypothetical protein
MITLFSAPKAFNDPHISLIQRNAVRSWLALGEQVEVLLMGDEPGLAEAASSLGVRLIPITDRGESGAPRISALFATAQREAQHEILCYLNADIILLADFLSGVKRVTGRLKSFLLVGQRWDVKIEADLFANGDWQGKLRSIMQDGGELHPPMGSDYFVFPSDQFQTVPDFVLGRAGWDNWMIFHARRMRIPVVDATQAITVIHQEHDYAHLPGGAPHYRHPESELNVALAGGLETMFRLRDADWILSGEELRRKSLAEWEWPRKLEADWIAALGAGTAAKMVRMAFHPRQAATYLMKGGKRQYPTADGLDDRGVKRS